MLKLKFKPVRKSWRFLGLVPRKQKPVPNGQTFGTVFCNFARAGFGGGSRFSKKRCRGGGWW